jgi:NADH-quinone oxidoreductase subunit J
MQIAFAILAALTIVSAIAAMSLRNLVHCALCLALAFAGIAAIYLQLGAAFVGWAQVLVYIGAVAILIVFAILLTRSGEGTPQPVLSRSWGVGIAIALGVFGFLAKAVMSSSLANQLPPVKPNPTVRQIGDQLMTRYVLPLEIIGLLLTAAAIGAVIIAMRDLGKGRLSSPQGELHYQGTKAPRVADELQINGKPTEAVREANGESSGDHRPEEVAL